MRLRRGIAWMLAGRIFYAVCMWLLVVAIARLGSTQMLGEYSFAIALTSPIVMLCRMNLRVFIVTDASGQFADADYLATRISTSVLAVLITAGVLLVFGSTWNVVVLVLLVAVYKSVESVSDYYHSLFQRQNRIPPFSVSLILHGLGVCFAFFVSLVYLQSVIAGAGLATIAWLALLVFYDRPRALQSEAVPETWSMAKVPKVIVACWLLGVVMALVSLRASIPVYFVMSELGPVQLGLYSAAAYFVVAGHLVVTSVMEVTSPRLAQARKAGDSDTLIGLSFKILGVLLSCGAVAIVASHFLGEMILTWVYGAEYASMAGLLTLLAISVTVGFAAQLLGSLLTVARLFSWQVAANVVCIVVISVACWFLLSRFGAAGAGVAIIAGNLALLAVNACAIMWNRDHIMNRGAAVTA